MIRFFDLILSGAALIVLCPFLFIIIIILRFTGEGEIFFLQERVGKDYIKFKIFKFVTMIKKSPAIGTGTVTMKGDPRILPFGKFLRRTKINELPQLLNIFLGHMSIIGPRPQTPSCFEAFTQYTQSIIVQVKPGLSGIGPIVFRGEEDILDGESATLDFYDNVIAPYKGEVEAWYPGKQKLSIYFMLIFLTAWVVVFPQSRMVWRLFEDLPTPPDELKKELNF
jgi:lipopolysaccharide/colanic/teichoic acid biosynthesis glycosyltransferase